MNTSTPAKASTSQEATGAAKSRLHTRACDLFGCKYPIVQTGMGWVSGPELTAATSSAGGLGILASATMTLDELRAAIDEMHERTDKPFGVNMRGDQVDIDQRVELMIREGIRVASFAGPPKRAVIDKLKENNIVTMPTVGMTRHAVKMQSWGVDALIAQGHEGGGHTGPVPTSLLLPEVAKAVDIPVLGAGGFKSGDGLVAALSWGAEGIAMGTRFLLTQESQVPAHVKEQYILANERSTVVTTKIDGAPQRVIETALVKRLENSSAVARFFAALRNAWVFRKITGMSFSDTISEALSMKKTRELSFAELAMAANAPMLTRASMVDGNLDAGILPTGQVTGIIGELPAVADLIAEIVAEAEATLDRLQSRFPAQ